MQGSALIGQSIFIALVCRGNQRQARSLHPLYQQSWKPGRICPAAWSTALVHSTTSHTGRTMCPIPMVADSYRQKLMARSRPIADEQEVSGQSEKASKIDK